MPMDGSHFSRVPKLISRIDSLETDLKQTKLTMGNAIVKLVKKVKKLEGFLKRRNLVLSDSEEEEPEVVQGLLGQWKEIQGRKRLKGMNIRNLVLLVSEHTYYCNKLVSTVGAKKSTSSQDKGQREGKAPMLSEETPKKSKEQILQEEASLAEE
ncbi:hypothetical protein Tco_1069726 [Tanacetum coccineum]|uniref:Uncharacterized protein n=1 Tax=Tanacetum coccineum TaxID=301880 RepID=A0ABQ5HKH4_9ASTR